MIDRFLTRFLAATILASTAVPAGAQLSQLPAVETAPLPALGDQSIERRPVAPLGEPDAGVTVEDPGTVVRQEPPAAGAVQPGADRPVVAADGSAVDPLAAAIASRIDAVGAAPRGFVEKRRYAAVETFYDQRGYKAAWTDGAGATPSARAVIDRLSAAAADGLDPASFGIPALPTDRSPADLAAFDVALSHAIVAFAEDASGGRVDPSKVNAKFITRKPERADPIAALASVAAATDVASAIDAFNPPHEAFRRLKAKLAEVRARSPQAKPEPIAEGQTLKPGMSDPRVVLLRARFDLPAEPDPLLADVYDETVVDAVKTFQASSGLLDDGIIGKRTLAVLNGADRDEEGEILANMEMWRWMPRDLGTDYVMVNVPEFMVRIVRNGRVTHEARVVVGTPTNQTPIFSDQMEYLVVNPYWHVPESIRLKEMLPEIQADPDGFFRRNGYEAVWNGQVIDPRSVIWDENAVKFVAIRQPPGEVNALGRIKFMFPNQHAVYLHDTPSRKLFDRDYRAYSHGCVRVHEPLSFAAAILEGEPYLTVGMIQDMFGGDERRVDLSQHIRVHIAYFNAWVDDAGVLQMRDDLYGHAGKVKAALEAPPTATQ